MRAPSRLKVKPIVGSVVFFIIAPGVVAGWIPYAVSGWIVAEPLAGTTAGRALGVLLILAGLACLIDCFARFALLGEGTPAPVAPTKRLVVSGLYRHVRNPMYLAVLSVILGQGLLLGSVLLVGYAALVWLLSHAFVLVYEEPTLRRQFGESYRRYESEVRRWMPRWQPWQSQEELDARQD